MGTDETTAKQTEQRETGELKARIRKLRAEGNTYREIAKLERISIAQISRILNEPTENEEGPKSQTSRVDLDGEEASIVFEMLEKDTSLPRIVIDLKMSPDKVNQLTQKWRELKLEQLKPPGYLVLTEEELKEILAIPYNLSATGMQFVLTENIFENPKGLLGKYSNSNDYNEVAYLLSIIEKIIQRSNKSIL